MCVQLGFLGLAQLFLRELVKSNTEINPTDNICSLSVVLISTDQINPEPISRRHCLKTLSSLTESIHYYNINHKGAIIYEQLI